LISKLRDKEGRIKGLSSAHLVRRSGVPVDDDDTVIKIVDLAADRYVIDPNTGQPLQDQWPGTGSPHNLVVTPKSSFLITFNKPVMPPTAGRSVVFNKAPFSGNMNPLPNRLNLQWPIPPECTGTIFPLCPNIVLNAKLLDAQGAPIEPATPVPCRISPLHQNNMAAYLITPLTDLPGSSTESLTPQGPDDVRMRIEVVVYDYQKNNLTGDPDGKGPGGPENLGVAGFHGERFYAGGAPSLSRSFSVLNGKRYVNAPVSPNVIYYAMGRGGMGAVDLDGHGLCTNTPGSGKFELVTCTLFYNPFGSYMMGTGNDYSYPVGLGSETPVPGINEGSSGMDTLVRDSAGDARLYPEPNRDRALFNISDIEVGDFLDTVFYDTNNPGVSLNFHSDLIFPQGIGTFSNNTISSPPTPNPPPLTVPVGMRPVDTILNKFDTANEGAFVILGKEVFTVDWPAMSGWPGGDRTSYIHLGVGGMSPDYPYPPYAPGTGPWTDARYLNTGPVAESATFGIASVYASRQQIGNFIFAADRANDTVRVLNSNTMEELTFLSGLKRPDGLAVTPDLRRLYVSNSAGDSVSVFDADPRSDTFLLEMGEIPVGGRPKGICAQPDYEDVFVCNYGSSTISIIDPATNTVRKTLSRLIDKPWDMVCGPRQTTFGWGTQCYHGYVSNHGGDNVLVFESGPGGLGGVGYDDIIGEVPLVGQGGTLYQEITKPRGICYDPLYLNDIPSQLNLVGGCFVAHSTAGGAAVSRIDFVNQDAPWGPILNPTGTPNFRGREFLITDQWTNLSGDMSAADVALPDFNRTAWLNNPVAANPYVTNYGSLGMNPSILLPCNNKNPIRFIWGSIVPTWQPDMLYVSFQNKNAIDIVDLDTGIVSSITGLPRPAGKLASYFKN